MTRAEQFLRALKENEEIRKYIAEHKPEEGVREEEALVKLAQEFGFEITEEELKEALRARVEKTQETRKQAEAAAVELSIEDLAAVSGGHPDCPENSWMCDEDYRHNYRCDDTYEKDEWCWSTDWCDAIIICYGNWGNNG